MPTVKMAYLDGSTIQHQKSANVTPVSTVGTGSDTLHTVTIPANTLVEDGDTLEWTGDITSVGGVVSGTNNAKILVDSNNAGLVAMTTMVAATSAQGNFSVRITKVDTDSVAVSTSFLVNKSTGSLFSQNDITILTVDLSADFDIELQGECNQSDALVTCVLSRLVLQ
jgi:hypothetical protein